VELEKQYSDPLEALTGLVNQVMRYCDRNGIQVPEKEKYLKMLRLGATIVSSRISSNEIPTKTISGTPTER
jgi:hypothetical protein